jgi:hypothetical protein
MPDFNRIQWRKQGKEINGYGLVLRSYRIKRSFFGFGPDYIVECFLAKLPGLSNRAHVETIEDGKAWAEKHEVEWHSLVDQARNMEW